MTKGTVISRETADNGKVPAVVLIDPKYGHNVAGALRACSSFLIPQLVVTGHRVTDELSRKGKRRLPREERMKAYSDVDLAWYDYPFDLFRESGARVVAVEVMDSAQPLTWFEHPDDAVYVFGPEDGGLAPVHKRHCTDFVIIPSAHCLNLACAVNVVLADRTMKAERAGLAPPLRIDEHRGFIETDESGELP